MNHLTRASRAEQRAADNRSPGAVAYATRWVEWAAARDGIALPTCKYSLVFGEQDGKGVALFYSYKQAYGGADVSALGYWDTQGYGRQRRRVWVQPEPILQLPVPMHCLPTKHLRAWQEAHQAGLSADDCYYAGLCGEVPSQPLLEAA